MIVRLIVPQTQGWFKDRHKYFERITHEWGGYTYWEGIGGWKDHKGTAKREPIIIIEVYVPADTRLNREWWTSFAEDVRVFLKQDCVYLQFSQADVILQADVQFVGDGEEDQPHHDIGGEG